MTDQSTSRRMAAVKQQNTTPELVVHQLLDSMRYEYRLHATDLPGCPDIVFRQSRKVIFVHGCFWHRHGCHRTSTPATRHAYWMEKFQRTVKRDKVSQRLLRQAGWKIAVIWECQIKNPTRLRNRIRTFLN